MVLEENKRYKATVAGNTYTIIGKESHYHMDIVNQLANEQLELIKSGSPQLSNEQASVLLALNTLSVQIKQQEDIIKLKKEISQLQDQLAKMTSLEERFRELEMKQRKAMKKAMEEDRPLTDEEMLNQIEMQKAVNEHVKEKIKQSHQKKNA